MVLFLHILMQLAPLTWLVRKLRLKSNLFVSELNCSAKSSRLNSFLKMIGRLTLSLVATKKDSLQLRRQVFPLIWISKRIFLTPIGLASQISWAHFSKDLVNHASFHTALPKWHLRSTGASLTRSLNTVTSSLQSSKVINFVKSGGRGIM